MSVRFRTPRGRVEGLGSAKSGTTHFLHQRMTAVVLVPLALWFVCTGISLVGADRDAVVEFFASPIDATLMFLFLSAALYHMSLGLQVVIEDYVHGEILKLVSLILTRFAAAAIGAATFFALLKFAISGT